jgi:hypothetical protein
LQNPAKHFRRFVAEDRSCGAVPELDVAGLVDQDDRVVAQAVHHLGEDDVRLPQLALGELARLPLRDFAQRAPQHRCEPGQARLAHVVGRTALEQLHRVVLADHAGHEDEGDGGSQSIALLQQVRAREAGELIVGQHHVPATGGQRSNELALVAQHLQLHVRVDALQLHAQQLDVQPRVFDEQRAQRPGIGFAALTHAAASFAASRAAAR